MSALWFSQKEVDKFQWLAHVNKDHKQLLECFKSKDKDKLVENSVCTLGFKQKRPEEYLEEEEKKK